MCIERATVTSVEVVSISMSMWVDVGRVWVVGFGWVVSVVSVVSAAFAITEFLCRTCLL